MTIANVFSLLTGMVLFLYGMNIMSDALQRAAGNQLETMLAKLTSSPFKSVLLGAGVTAVIQSSSATSVMAVGFVNSGVMKLRQAIGIILGAILGTSITGWIIALSQVGGGSGWVAIFSTETITGLFAIVGILLHSFAKDKNALADVLLGFVVLMTGIGMMSGSVASLAEEPEFIAILTRFSNPLIGVFVGIIAAVFLQSASAAVGVLQALSLTGAITFSVAFPLLLGISIGASFPVLLSALGAGTNGKRTALVYLLISVLGAVIVGVLFYATNLFFHYPIMDKTLGPVGIAIVNTLFRLLNVIFLWPFIGAIEKLATVLVKDEPVDEETAGLVMLPMDERLLPYTSLAMDQAKRALDDMATRTKEAVEYSFANLNEYDAKRNKKVEQRENLVDQYEDAIGNYLMKLSQNDLSLEENTLTIRYLHTLTNFERISDYAVQISHLLKNKNEAGISLNEESLAELTVVQDAVTEIAAQTTNAFISGERVKTADYAALNLTVRSLINQTERKQVSRLQKGKCTMEQNEIFSTLLNNYSHIIANCTRIVLSMREFRTGGLRFHTGDLNLDLNLKDSPAYKALLQYREKYGVKSDEPMPEEGSISETEF